MERSLEVVDVGLHRVLPHVRDRADAHYGRASAPARLGAGVLLIELAEGLAVAAPIADGALAGVWRARLEAGQPVAHVAGEVRLAELSVADDVDTDGGLPRYDVGGRSRHYVAAAEVALRSRANQVNHLRRPDEAAHVRGEDTVVAPLHATSAKDSCRASGLLPHWGRIEEGKLCSEVP